MEKSKAPADRGNILSFQSLVLSLRWLLSLLSFILITSDYVFLGIEILSLIKAIKYSFITFVPLSFCLICKYFIYWFKSKIVML